MGCFCSEHWWKQLQGSLITVSSCGFGIDECINYPWASKHTVHHMRLRHIVFNKVFESSKVQHLKNKTSKQQLSAGFTDCCAQTYLSFHLSSPVGWRWHVCIDQFYMPCQPEKWDARSVVWVSTRGEIEYKFLNCLVCFSTSSCHSMRSMLCLGGSSPLFPLAARDTCFIYFHFVVLIAKKRRDSDISSAPHEGLKWRSGGMVMAVAAAVEVVEERVAEFSSASCHDELP